MNLPENIVLALAGLKANKMRSLLTMLGIIIGIGSVIAIVTIGDSITSSVTTTMQDMGATNITVILQENDEQPASLIGAAPVDNKIAESDLFTDEMIDAFSKAYKAKIDAISISVSGGMGKVQNGRDYAKVSVMGINEGYQMANNLEIIEGRLFREGEIKSNRYTALVSDKFTAQIFDEGESPLGQEIRVDTGDQMQTYMIVGVYKYIETTLSLSTVSEKDFRTDIYIPITTCQMVVSAEDGHQYFIIKGAEDINVDEFSEDIKAFFGKYYKDNIRYSVNTYSMEASIASMATILDGLSLAVMVIAAISLLVGGVGVMNIMLVSVTERTKEIGTRKAIGAKKVAIRVQFITEAIIICVLGGIIGVAVGFGLGFCGSVLLECPVNPSYSTMVIAVIFSMVIGVFFGYYPANKAAKMDPIEALRYE